MSLPKHRYQGSFFDCGSMLESLFSENDRFAIFQQKILPILRDEVGPEIDKLYHEVEGRPAIEPVVMAGATLLQFMEKVPDRKAVEMIRLHLGWKFALDLPVDFDGFHSTSLVVFRNRLIKGKQEKLIFETIVRVLRDEGLVKKRCKQRLDSTHILGCVSEMGRLEMVRETLRLVIKELSNRKFDHEIPNWDRLVERYVDCEIDWRTQDRDQLKSKFVQAGEDCWQLLSWASSELDGDLSTNSKLQLLERVFSEQYEKEDEEIVQRAKPASDGVVNPHDPDCQYSTKGKSKKEKEKNAWTGYKGQVLESVSDDPTPKDKAEPTDQFVLDLVTTDAITSDIEGMHQTFGSQENEGYQSASELYVDSGYISDDTLAEAQAAGYELTGPARRSPDHLDIYSSDQFQVNTESRQAICPGGHTNSQCSLINDQYKQEKYYRFEWGSQCDDCPLQQQCTKSKNGRRILTVGVHHNLLQERREKMKESQYKEKMKRRNGVEGTISELVRLGLRRSRYRGKKKTSLFGYLVGAACNVHRWIRLIDWQMQTELG